MSVKSSQGKKDWSGGGGTEGVNMPGETWSDTKGFIQETMSLYNKEWKDVRQRVYEFISKGSVYLVFGSVIDESNLHNSSVTSDVTGQSENYCKYMHI